MQPVNLILNGNPCDVSVCVHNILRGSRTFGGVPNGHRRIESSSRAISVHMFSPQRRHSTKCESLRYIQLSLGFGIPESQQVFHSLRSTKYAEPGFRDPSDTKRLMERQVPKNLVGDLQREFGE